MGFAARVVGFAAWVMGSSPGFVGLLAEFVGLPTRFAARFMVDLLLCVVSALIACCVCVFVVSLVVMNFFFRGEKGLSWIFFRGRRGKRRRDYGFFVFFCGTRVPGEFSLKSSL